MTPWYRIEGSIRSAAMTGGVEARVADPLWMLARQWQVGEFIGDDAGTPLAATATYESASITTTWLGADAAGDGDTYDPQTPLERNVESATHPSSGGARLSQASRAARSLTRILAAAGAMSVVERLVAEHPLAVADAITLGERGAALTRLLGRRSFDGLSVAAMSESAVRALADNPALSEAIAEWRRSTRARYSLDDGAWEAERMEHDFAVGAPTPDRTGIRLHADGYTGGRLDWYSFDVDGDSHQRLSDAPKTFTTIPTPVRFDGMPAARWWEFEDAAVQFGDIDAGPNDLARMIVADFATVYGDDWFVLPLTLDNGTLTRVRDVVIADTFGEQTTATSIVAGDDRPGLGRSWSMFEMHADTSVDHDVAPLLFVPPVLATSLHGPPLERVEFARDEGANLGWAIERSVEGPLGRPVDRREAWLAATPPEPESERETKDPANYDEQVWSYRLEEAAPPFWVPLVPERITDDGSEIHFRRGRLQSWEHLDAGLVGAHGETLEPGRPLVIREEEIPRGGITVERRWQYARWVDGSVHLWIQRRRRQGRGERSSGLRWDVLGTGP